MKRNFVNAALLAAMLSASSFSVEAQTQTRVQELFSSSTGLKSFINGSHVVLASSENDKRVKIISSSSSLKKEWEQFVDGSLMFAGNLNDKVLVIVSTDFAAMQGGYNSTYKAFLLNSADGKKLSEKVIYTGNDDYLTDATYELSKDHKSLTLYARETSNKRSVKVAPGAIGMALMAKKVANNENKTRNFSVSTFNENLEITDKVIPVLPAGDFVDAVKTANNDLYIAVAEDKKGVTIARYEAGKEKSAATVFEPFSHSSGLLKTERLSGYVSLLADTLGRNVVYLKGAFKNDDEFICVFNKYDLVSNNHKRFLKSFKKADFKALEKSFVPVNKEFSSLELGSATGVEVLKVIPASNGYLVAIGDVHYVAQTPGSHLPPTYTANGILVYMLDENLQEKSLAAIPREYSQLIKPDLKAYYKDDAWYLFASELYRGRFSISKINASTGKVEDIKLIEPEKAGKGDLVNLDEMLVTNDQLFLPLEDLKMSFSVKLKYDVNLYQIRW